MLNELNESLKKVFNHKAQDERLNPFQPKKDVTVTETPKRKHYKLHLGEKPPKTRIPQTPQEMRDFLSSRVHTPHLREPVNRKERREWDKFWTLKGKGFTKAGRKLRPLEERIKRRKEAKERVKSRVRKVHAE